MTLIGQIFVAVLAAELALNFVGMALNALISARARKKSLTKLADLEQLFREQQVPAGVERSQGVEDGQA